MAVQDAEAPGRQHQQPGAGKQDADEQRSSARACRPLKPGAMTAISSGVGERRRRAPAPRRRSASRAPTAPATRSASRRSPRAEQRRVDGDERRRQRALAEQVLEKVRDAERGVERVGGVRLQAEVVREDAQPDEAGDAAQQDARRRRRTRPALQTRLRRPRSASPSVPLDFFIRNVLMKTSMSPSSTRLTSPTCSLVRWSFTSWYGCRT